MFFTIEELGNMAPPRWKIEGLFEAESLVMVAGPPGSFKSFLVLDWILCMASGKNWNQRKTETSKCLYVLGEGKSSLNKRVNAWRQENHLNAAETAALRENFLVTFDVPQLAQRSAVDNLLSRLSDRGFRPDVVVVDTFARSFVGMDENGQRDVGLWVEQADRLRAAGLTVIFLHHTAKNTEFGVRYRGSSALLGAMDTAMTVQRDQEIPHGIKVEVTKQKDHDEGDPMYFMRKIVRSASNAEGSVVLAPTIKMDERFTEEGQKVDEIMDALMADPRFESDRARARELARQFDFISETAAQGRITRRRKEEKKKEIESQVA